MRMNDTAARPGVASVASDPEVLPVYTQPAALPDPRMRIGCVEFNRQTIIQSPCFWFLLGAGAAVAVYFVVKSAKK